jgi:AmmeMemoRadiSam system protein B
MQLLKEQIAAHYVGPRGPGMLPRPEITRNTRAIIAPDSPYHHCGDCMAESYKAIAESPLPDVYIIISANHTSQECGLSKSVFNTPLGLVRSDEALADAIAKHGTLPINEAVHARDQGIEVQLPFLIHAKYTQMDHLRILAVIINETVDLERAANDIKAALKQLGRNAIYIASTDLTHYGPVFHYVPFTTEIQARVYELDDEMLDIIKRQDADKYAAFIAKQFPVMEGLRTIELLLRLAGHCAVRVMRHYTSGDIVADYKNSVSYAAVIMDEQ